MDTLGLVTTSISLVIFALALYEALAIAGIIGKIPRFWYFFLAAISFVVVRRVLELVASGVPMTLPSWWSALDADGTPIIFSALLFIWVYDMKKSFEKASPKQAARLLAPEQVQPPNPSGLVARDDIDR